MKPLPITVLLITLALYVGYSNQQPPCMEQQTLIDNGAAVTDTGQDGQSFIAACSGVLANFVLVVSSGPTGDSTLEARLYAGQNWPANANSDPGLGVVTTVVNNGAAPGTRIVFDFSGVAPVLNENDPYAIRVRALPGSPPVGIEVGNATPYTNGDFLFINDLVSTGNRNTGADITFEYSIIPAPTPPAVAQGDPHLVGLRGQHYDFNGRANAVFNLLTSAVLQVNSLFTTMEIAPTFFEGTYLQTISIQARGVLAHPIVIDAGNSSFVDHPSLRFGAGDDAVWFEPTQLNNSSNATRRNGNIIMKTNAVQVTWTATETTATALGITNNHNDRVVRVATVTITNTAVIEVFCVENGYHMHRNGRLHQNTLTARRNLDVRVRMLNNNMNVHGVIGATNDAAVPRPPGKDEDYEVKDGLLGTDFVHNLYPRNTN